MTRPLRAGEPTIALGIRITISTHDRIAELAEKENRSVALFIRDLVESRFTEERLSDTVGGDGRDRAGRRAAEVSPRFKS